MSKPSFTPGPWRVNKYGSVGAGEFGSDPITASVEPFWGGDLKQGDHQANAHLIAAAPELYEALVKARGYVGMVRSSDVSGDDPIFGVMDEIDAALAKARGE